MIDQLNDHFIAPVLIISISNEKAAFMDAKTQNNSPYNPTLRHSDLLPWQQRTL